MPELRWTLLIIGALFILGLAVWEFRRQRQVPRQSANATTQSGADRVSPSLETGAASAGGEGARVHREPIITLPELHPDGRGESRLTARREPAQDPPIVEMDDATFSRLHVDGETDNNTVEVMAHDGVVDFDVGEPDPEPVLPTYESQLRAAEGMPIPSPDDRGAAELAAAAGLSPVALPSAGSEEAPIAPANGADNGLGHATPASAQSVGFATDEEHTVTLPAANTAAAATSFSHPVGATADGAPIVEWPREQSRKIVALRLVSAPAARFPGRAVRQALAAEGFVLGKFDIFHKPGPDERAVLSAASLSKPGTFTLNTIDAQRFGGISLFAVLPGPLPPQQTFDELLSTARSLNDRLQGALQDERGEPLTPMRSASIRQSLSDGGDDGSDGAGAGFETRQ